MASLPKLRPRPATYSPASAPAFLRRLHEGPDTVDELLDRYLVKKKEPSDADGGDNSLAVRRRVASTRREALSLYRDVLRATRFFTWMDERGELWRDRLRENARREFEEARFETDPEVVARLLVGGRDAVQAAVDRLVDKANRMVEEERNRDRPSQGRG